jgi:hypothetical protein
MNFVAINLAHDIVTGRRSAAEARQGYSRLYQAFKRGEKPPCLSVPLPKEATSGPDTPTLP